MMINFGQITVEQFLQDYWQQRPLLIKGGLITHYENDFIDPISPDELAGLASDSSVESRLIYRQADKWLTDTGPIESYEHLGETYWSLLVQSANHWSQPVQDLVEIFHFLPQWRFDDVMISFATKGGGVGPHVDNYDVFICQGSGSRHWRVGFKDDYTIKMASDTLMHVEAFDASIDAILEAGDILYIPPGFAHEGLSLNESMSYSVGYQSTNANALFSNFADYLIDFNEKPQLLVDSQRVPATFGQISKSDVSLIRQLLIDTINDNDKLHQFIGQQYTESSHELDIASSDYSLDEWLTIFKEQPLIRLNGLRVAYLDDNVEQGFIYIDGEMTQLKKVCAQTIRYIANASILSFDEIKDDMTNSELTTLLCEYTNRGYWYFEE